MPQALKYMIPNIVSNFMGLFKDTTLVSIIGLYDLLGMINEVSQDPSWIGLHHEPLFTAAVIFPPVATLCRVQPVLGET